MDVLLIYPSYDRTIYKNAKLRAGVPIHPPLNLALLAAPIVNSGYSVKILDLNVEENPEIALEATIKKDVPRFVGITFTTPLYSQAKRIATFIKELSPRTMIIVGGAHATTFPKEVVEEPCFDIVAKGEADFVLRDILNSRWDSVQGIVFKEKGNIVDTGNTRYIEDLDRLLFPVWSLYDLRNYNRPSLTHRRSPPGYLETSRGCPWGCVFCNKNVHGRHFRTKSAKRVVDEIEYMLKIGFKEIGILDDTFSTDIVRAKDICDEIMKRKLKFPWHPLNGMRVDRVDRELFEKMKKAGCYKVSFGIESGNQEVINRIDKGINLEQVRKAVSWARKVNLETLGYFMIGLPGEDEKAIKDTIRFAKELKLDMVKFSVTVPFPGTKMFEEWDRLGLIKTKDWDKYNYFSPYYELYNHPTLSHETIRKYYKKAYRSFYSSPAYLFRRLIRDLKDGILLRDIRLLFKTG